VSPVADMRIGTFAVEWSLQESSEGTTTGLKAGMHGRVRTYTREAERILIPEQAILYRKGSCFVSVVSEVGPETVTSLRPVSLGDRRSSQIEIIEGLSQGERFVVKSSRILRSGERVLLDD
jgi:HlyD family secretion protein